MYVQEHMKKGNGQAMLHSLFPLHQKEPVQMKNAPALFDIVCRRSCRRLRLCIIRLQYTWAFLRLPSVLPSEYSGSGCHR